MEKASELKVKQVRRTVFPADAYRQKWLDKGCFWQGTMRNKNLRARLLQLQLQS